MGLIGMSLVTAVVTDASAVSSVLFAQPSTYFVEIRNEVRSAGARLIQRGDIILAGRRLLGHAAARYPINGVCFAELLAHQKGKIANNSKIHD